MRLLKEFVGKRLVVLTFGTGQPGTGGITGAATGAGVGAVGAVGADERIILIVVDRDPNKLPPALASEYAFTVTVTVAPKTRSEQV